MGIVVGSWWLIYVFFLHSFKTSNPPVQGIYQNHWSLEWRLLTLESPNIHSTLDHVELINEGIWSNPSCFLPPTLCPFTAVSPHASQFSWVAPHTSHLPNMEQWHRRTMPCCCGPWLTISSPVMQKSINLSKIHQAFATTSDLLFAYAMPWYGHQQPTAILWRSCCFSSQSRLSSLAHWLIVEGEPLQGLQRIGRSWHLPRVDQVSSGHLP